MAPVSTFSTGDGRLNSLFKLLAIGITESDIATEKSEEGKVPPSSPRQSPVQGESGYTVQYCLKLLFYVIGLQASYLTWGVLQVGH